MKSLKPFILFLLCSFMVACSFVQPIVQQTPIVTAAFAKKKALTNEEKKDWYVKDVFQDSIPGVSLDKAYNFLKNKTGNTVIVAVIDTEIDLAQEELKDQIWVNKDEIPHNNLDDDNNGYIDDIHGWNYVGSKKENSSSRSRYYSHFEYVRIIKKYDSIFKNINSSKNVSEDEKREFQVYQNAYLTYNTKLNKVRSDLNSFEIAKKRFIVGVEILEQYIPDIEEPYNIERLDSLKLTLKNKEETEKLQQLIVYKKYKHSLKSMNNQIRFYKETIDYQLNFDFDERSLTNDNSSDLDDFPYGNNNVQGLRKFSHSTKMSSIIAATRNDTLVEGINDKAKIMPLSISVSGNEHDKDIALAIRYAVDNGAKIISMSFVKYFTQNNVWINDAIKYAAKKDVLIVRASGNESFDLDSMGSFPNDYDSNNDEFSNNFVVVGANRAVAKENFVAEFSNYGKNNVDIFAPGKFIYTTFSNNNYKYDSGTSLAAPIVSGIAALIRSHYPSLSASEVKQIILESGVTYDIMVNKPSTNKEKELVPFSSLSKSGKVVNAYNALLMAEEVSKKKKRRK